MSPRSNVNSADNASEEFLWKCSSVCAWVSLVLSTVLFFGSICLLFWVLGFGLPMKWVLVGFIVAAGGLYIVAFATSVLLVSRKANFNQMPMSNTIPKDRIRREPEGLSICDDSVNIPSNPQPDIETQEEIPSLASPCKGKSPPPPYEGGPAASRKHLQTRYHVQNHENCSLSDEERKFAPMTALTKVTTKDYANLSSEGSSPNRPQSSLSDSVMYRCSECVLSRERVDQEWSHNVAKALLNPSVESLHERSDSELSNTDLGESNSEPQSFIKAFHRRVSDGLRRSMVRDKDSLTDNTISYPTDASHSHQNKIQRSPPVIKIESPSPPPSDDNSDYFKSDDSSTCSLQPEISSARYRIEPTSPMRKYWNLASSIHKFQSQSQQLPNYQNERNEVKAQHDSESDRQLHSKSISNIQYHQGYTRQPFHQDNIQQTETTKMNSNISLQYGFHQDEAQKQTDRISPHQQSSQPNVAAKPLSANISFRQNFQQNAVAKYLGGSLPLQGCHPDVTTKHLNSNVLMQHQYATRFAPTQYQSANPNKTYAFSEVEGRFQGLPRIDEQSKEEAVELSQQKAVSTSMVSLHQPRAVASNSALQQISGSSFSPLHNARSIGTIFPPPPISTRPKPFKPSSTSRLSDDQQSDVTRTISQPTKNISISQKINYFEMTKNSDSES